MPPQQAGELQNQTKLIRTNAKSTKHFRNKINFTYPARRADHVTPPALLDTLPACPTAHPTTAAH